MPSRSWSRQEPSRFNGSQDRPVGRLRLLLLIKVVIFLFSQNWCGTFLLMTKTSQISYFSARAESLSWSRIRLQHWKSPEPPKKDSGSATLRHGLVTGLIDWFSALCDVIRQGQGQPTMHAGPDLPANEPITLMRGAVITSLPAYNYIPL